MQETQKTRVRSPGWEDSLEEGMAMHSSILAWRIPLTEEPGGLQSIVSHVGHDWSDLACTHTCMITIQWIKYTTSQRLDIQDTHQSKFLYPVVSVTCIAFLYCELQPAGVETIRNFQTCFKCNGFKNRKKYLIYPQRSLGPHNWSDIKYVLCELEIK